MNRPLVDPFPTPGPLLGLAYRTLWLAAEGSDHQKQVMGDPGLLPRPWDPSTCRDPQLRAELWTWLDAVVIWFNHAYAWDPAGLVPACWPQHPHLVHEIAVLADQRRRAGIALTSDALEDWHRYTVPGFQDRLKTRIRTYCDNDHQPSPARARHARHTDAAHAGERRAHFVIDVRALEPDPPLEPHRPRLTLLDDRTGELVEGPDVDRPPR